MTSRHFKIGRGFLSMKTQWSVHVFKAALATQIHPRMLPRLYCLILITLIAVNRRSGFCCQNLPSHFKTILSSELPITPITTRAERRQFRNHLRSRIGLDGGIDFDSWAEYWNQEALLNSSNPCNYRNGRIRLKTASHLRQYYGVYEKTANDISTMQSIRHVTNSLQAE